MGKSDFKPELVLVNFRDSLKKAINGASRLAVKSDDKILKGETLWLLDALTLFDAEWKRELERSKQ